MIYSNDLKYKTRVGKNGESEAPEAKRKVFISYRKKDNEFGLLDKVADYVIKASDCAVWYDSSLTPGENYDEEIAAALRECDAVILLLTKDVLSSDYIWKIEIKSALEYKKGIIPIALGLPSADFGKVTEQIGSLHILSGERLFFGELKTEEYEKEEKVFTDALNRSLARFVINRDIANKVSDFFAAKKNELPFKFLTVEQIYLLAYGLLNGLNTCSNTDEALNMLESLINLYSSDEETEELKGRIAFDLMMYFIRINDVETALKYGEKAVSYRSVRAAEYLGQLYWRGDLVKQDKDKALDYFNLGIMQNLPSSTRLAIELLLSTIPYGNLERYRELQPYYEHAALYGEEWDLYNLLSFYWNADFPDKIGQFPKQYGNKLSGLCDGIMYLKTAYESNGRMRVLKAGHRADFNDHILMHEIQHKGHSFGLYKIKTGQNTSDVLLVRDKKTVIYTEKCVWGWGECPTFDMGEDNGLLFFKTGEFDHYCGETIFTTMTLINPLSENIISMINYSDWMKGKRDLRFNAYIK